MTEFERFKYHDGDLVQVELFGIPLRLAQDPSSQHLGTSVWDASIVLAKYLERQASRPRGDWSRAALSGRRGLELGAGMGLAGMALALAGCDVMLTDVAEVLPLLKRNAAQIRPEALKAASHDGATVRHDGVGRAEVRELDWAAEGHAEAAKAAAGGWGLGAAGAGGAATAKGARRRRSSGGGGNGGKRKSGSGSGGNNDGSGATGASAKASSAAPPFEFILAADCVYSELAIPVFLEVCLACSSRQTSILVANEKRSLTTAAEWERLFSLHFSLKRIPFAKLHPEYRHPLIELWQLRRKRAPGGGGGDGGEGEAEEGEGEDAGPEQDGGAVGAGEAGEAATAATAATAAALGGLSLVDENKGGRNGRRGDPGAADEEEEATAGR